MLSIYDTTNDVTFLWKLNKLSNTELSLESCKSLSNTELSIESRGNLNETKEAFRETCKYR